MLRKLGMAVVLALFVAGLAAAQVDTKGQQGDKPTQATIAKVDAGKNTITLKMRDAQGKETERTFDLGKDVKYLDEAGKAVTLDQFKTGGTIWVTQKDGRIMELRQGKPGEKPPQN